MTSLNQQIIKSGLKKKHIASKLKISPMQLSHIISGKRKAKPSIEKKIRQLISGK